MNSIIPSSPVSHGSQGPPPTNVTRNIWIVLEARRRATVFHFDEVINRQDQSLPYNENTEDTSLITQPSAQDPARRAHFGRMAAYDLFNSDLFVLDQLLSEIKDGKAKGLSQIHLIVFLFSILFWQIDLPAKLKAGWLKHVLYAFWGTSCGYWSYSVAGWWCLDNFAAGLKHLGHKLEDNTLEKEDRVALTGWKWRGVDIFNALW